MSFRQLPIGELIKERGVCFRVTPKTGLQIQKLFNQKVAVKDAPYLFISKYGELDCGYEPDDDYEQVILAPEKFESQKHLMEFLCLGGHIVTRDTYYGANDGLYAYFDESGCLVSNADEDGFDTWCFKNNGWKPRIDKSTANNPDNPV